MSQGLRACKWAVASVVCLRGCPEISAQRDTSVASQAADFYMSQLGDKPYYFRVDAASRPNVRLADPAKLDSGRGAAAVIPASGTPTAVTGLAPADTANAHPPNQTQEIQAESPVERASADSGDVVERWGVDADRTAPPVAPPGPPSSTQDLLIGRQKQRARVAAHAKAASAAGFAPAGANMDGAHLGGVQQQPPPPTGATSPPTGATGRPQTAPTKKSAVYAPSERVPTAASAGVPVFDLSAARKRRQVEDAAMLQRSREFMAARAAQDYAAAAGTATGGAQTQAQHRSGLAQGTTQRRAAMAADLAGTPNALRGVLPPGMSEQDAVLKAGSDLVKSLDKWGQSISEQAARRTSLRQNSLAAGPLPVLPRRRPMFRPVSASVGAHAGGDTPPSQLAQSHGPPIPTPAAGTQGAQDVPQPADTDAAHTPASTTGDAAPLETPSASRAMGAAQEYQGRALARGVKGGSYRMGWGLFEDDDSDDSDEESCTSAPPVPPAEGVQGGSTDDFEADGGRMLAAPLQGEYALEGEEAANTGDDTTEQILKQALGEEGYAAAVQKGGAGGGAQETKAGEGKDPSSRSVKMPIVGVLSGAPPSAEIEARSASAAAASKAPALPLYKLSDFTTSSFARLMDALQGWVTQRTLVLNGLGRPSSSSANPQNPQTLATVAESSAGGIGAATAPPPSTAEYEKLDTVVVDASPQSAALARQVAQAFAQVCRSCPRSGGPLSSLLTPPVQRHVAGVMKTFEVFGDAHDFTPGELRALSLVIALSAPCMRAGHPPLPKAEGDQEGSVLAQWRKLLLSIGAVLNINEVRVLFGVLCGGHRHMLDQPVMRAYLAASGLDEAEMEEARAEVAPGAAAQAEAEVHAACAAAAAGGGAAGAMARSVTRAMPLVAGRPSREQLRNMSPEQQAEWGEISRQAALRLISLQEEGASL